MPEWKYKLLVRDLCMQSCALVRAKLPRSNLYFDVHDRPKTWGEICRVILDPLVEDLLTHGEKVAHLYVLL